MSSRAKAIIAELASHRDERNIVGMARFGIATNKAFGIKHPILKKIAKRLGRDNQLALELWDTGYHEARLIATLVAEPKIFTKRMANAWVKDINSWDICDGFTGNLVDRTPYAYEIAQTWARRKEEFVRRAGFALMAWLPVHDKKAPDAAFDSFFPLIREYSTDERNFVKKAVNWALRQLGKRNRALNRKAITTAKLIAKIDSKSARWIARDALKELESNAVQSRLKAKQVKK
jgi:3-methyladenine DNA glycosylase AlkD